MSTPYTTITAGTLYQDWPEDWGTSGTLGIFCTQNFTADDGQSFVAGNGDSLSGEFVTESVITVSSNTGRYAAYVIPTTDTSTPNTVRYFVRIFDQWGAYRADLFSQPRHLRSSLGSSISELQWANDNAQSPFRPQADTKPTTDEMNTAIAAAIVNAALDQDYAIGDFASLDAAVTAAAITGGTLVINAGTTCPDNLSVPLNVTLRITRKGLITMTTGKTLTLAQPPEAGAYKIFANALSGQGTVVLPGFTEAVPDWWATNTTPGTTVMTDAVNAAMASGAGTIRIDSNYRVGLVTISSSVHRVYGTGTFTQNAAGANILTGTSLSNLTIEGLSFIGVSGNVSESQNNGIDLTSCTNVRIRDNYFTTLRYHAIFLKGCSDVIVEVNRAVSISDSIVRCYGVTDSSICNNYWASPQFTGSGSGFFTVAMALDSTVDHAFGNNERITIDGNKFENLVNGQALLVHSGLNCVIANNVMNDVLAGIVLSPFTDPPSTDIVSDNIIANNTYNGTSTTGAGAGQQNSGIALSGAASFEVIHTTVVGNVINNANVIGDVFNQGGLTLNYVDDAIIVGNIFRDCVGSGIAIGNPATRIQIADNNVIDTVAASDTSRVGILVDTGSGSPNVTGRIENNFIDTATQGVRFNVATTVKVGLNDFTNVTTQYLNPANADFGITAALGTTTPLDITASLAAGTQSPYTPTQTSTLNAVTIPEPNKPWRLIITTSGTSSFDITFGTNFKSQGVLATGTVSGKVFVVEFISDGTNLNEVSRTSAM